METQTQNFAMLAPESILVGSNVRFGLKKQRVDELAESIKNFGRVHTNLVVEPLETPGPNGEEYTLRAGHYRRAAVEKLNKDGAGLLLPCQIEEPLTGVDRIKHQLSENMDRENMSPMDMAHTISDLLEAGLAKVEIRQLFQRQRGKKMDFTPLSNAMLNIYLSFLDFPKPIQNKLHNGELGIEEGYKLSKKPRDKWEEIVAKAEADRLAQYEEEDKDEEKFLESTRKAEEAEAKAKADKEAALKASELAEKAKQEASARADKLAEAFKAQQKAKEKEAKEKAAEAFKAAEAEAKAAEKAADAATKEAEKLAAKVAKNEELAAERKKKLEEARKAAEKAAKGKKLDIDKAAAKVTGSGPVPLNSTEIRKVTADLALPGSFPKVTMIGRSLARCWSGEITDAQLLAELGYITGERKEKPKTWNYKA